MNDTLLEEYINQMRVYCTCKVPLLTFCDKCVHKHICAMCGEFVKGAIKL